MSNPFDFVNDILKDKKNLMVDDQSEKDYIPFIVNKGLSYYKDCVFQVNEVNRRPHMEKRMQYDFLLKIIRGYKRPYARWEKKTKDDDFANVKKYFSLSNTKTHEALRLLSKEDLKIIKNKLNVGGVK
jgi:hypothetical protein